MAADPIHHGLAPNVVGMLSMRDRVVVDGRQTPNMLLGAGVQNAATLLLRRKRFPNDPNFK